MEKYTLGIEEKMRLFYNNLSEKDKRYYAAVEAVKLGHGGIQYISSLLGCSRQTISKGLEELGSNTLVAPQYVRRPGGGRKRYDQKYPDIDTVFFKGA